MAKFKVDRKEAENFSKVWNKGGISIILTPEAVDFAADFANVVLNNFIQMCELQANTKKQPKPLIIEGT